MSEFAPLINGVQYSGSSVRINIFNVSLSGFRGIMWKKSRGINLVHGTGNEVNAYSYGKKEPSAALTLLQSDLLALEAAAPEKDISLFAPFSIIVSFVEGVNVVVYSIENCQFTGYDFNMKTDDKFAEITLPIVCTDIIRKR